MDKKSTNVSRRKILGRMSATATGLGATIAVSSAAEAKPSEDIYTVEDQKRAVQPYNTVDIAYQSLTVSATPIFDELLTQGVFSNPGSLI